MRWFAYPYGGVQHFRPGLASYVEEAGYEGCLSGFGGFVYAGSDRRLLPREAVPYFSVFEFWNCTCAAVSIGCTR